MGSLAAVDQDAADSHTFSLVAGAGDDDNASFAIVGDELRTATGLDFETQSSYSVRVQADDGNGGTFARALTVDVTDVNEPPAATDTSATTAEDTLVTITLSGSDPDDDALTFQIAGTTAQGGTLHQPGSGGLLCREHLQHDHRLHAARGLQRRRQLHVHGR